MSSLPHIVLADDLTGAAEVAAIAHEAGLSALVLTRLPRKPVAADVIVFDTNTRLAPPAKAARIVRTATRRLRRWPHAGFFVKVDSVLRGSVGAQLSACAKELGRPRTVLVPANPSLGRVIRQGRYAVNGRPLHETAFAHDPHHPRVTDEVATLLGTGDGPLAVCASQARRLPRAALVVGETATAADVRRWAGRVDARTLPAGGGDFFRAWLKRQGGARRAVPDYQLPVGGGLLLHGTTAAPADARALPFRGLLPPSLAVVRAALAQRGAVAVAPVPRTLGQAGAPAAIARGFAHLTRSLHRTGSFRHLLIAGGATAATVLRALGWSELRVVRNWDQGVVTLQPVAEPDFAVTMKPGSYRWPSNLRRATRGFLPS
ncbi:MAG TPA: four-carbon acid sugar kinase family protein [Lacunisphaera sp.]|nr:four-carbon acid sugar kinase family protein [Lacunisphaera sp.]